MMLKFSSIEVTSNKVRRNDVDFSSIKITLKKVCRNDVDIKEKILKQRWFFAYWNYVEENTSKRHWFFAHQIYVKEVMSKRCRFFTGLCYTKKVHRNNEEIRQYFSFKPSLFLLTITLKYTLFPLNHPYSPKYLFLKKMQACFCRGGCKVRIPKNRLIPCTFSLFKVGRFYWKLILKKRDFKFSPTKNLFRLFETI